MNGFVLTLNQWALLFGAVMPVLVGLVTKLNASASLKATTLLVLDAVNGVLTEFFTAPAGFDWGDATVNALTALIVSVATYYGFLKHTISVPLNSATRNVGIGGKVDYDVAG